MFQIDRHFLFLHSEKLAVFTERVLRSTQHNPSIPKPEGVWDDLNENVLALRKTIADPFLKRKDKTDAIRAKEAPVVRGLEKLATHVESSAKFKSDALTSGFHLHSDHAKGETRRKARMSAKMEQLQVK